MISLRKTAAAAVMTASALLGQQALAQPAKASNGVLVDAQGKTLYVYTKDSANKSNCEAGCLAAWPAFVAKPEAKAQGDLGVITRADGTRQWTHKERPLYYYVGDANPGDRTGDKQGGVWFVVPAGADGKTVGSSAGKASSITSNY
jgi:predicted lipoprotein with Yx(FWY)xxD motif